MYAGAVDIHEKYYNIFNFQFATAQPRQTDVCIYA